MVVYSSEPWTPSWARSKRPWLLRHPYRAILVLAVLICTTYTFGYMFHNWSTAAPIGIHHQHYEPKLPQRDLDTFTSHAINNTVVVVPVNTGMLYWVKNMLCGLEATEFNTSSIVFWALDEGAEASLKEMGHATYRDPSLYSVSSDSNLHGNTREYTKMMRERPTFFINLLGSGFDLLMLDADIMFYQSPLKLIPENRENVDIAYSTDSREFYSVKDAFTDAKRRGPYVPPVCNGLFWMKASEETISLWTEMKDIFADESFHSRIYQYRVFQDDQRGMDVMLNDGRVNIVAPYPDGINEEEIPQSQLPSRLNLVLMDQTKVANGQLVANRAEQYQSHLKELRKSGEDRIAVHMNWSAADLTKEEGAKIHGTWLLDDNQQCAFRAKQ